MKLGSFLLLATALFPAAALYGAAGVPLEVMDARNRKASGVSVEAAGPDEEGWWTLKVTLKATRAKGNAVLVWPWDGLVKQPDGPAAVPVLVIDRGDTKALANPRVVAAIATPVVLGLRSIAEQAAATGYTEAALDQAVRGLAATTESFGKGLGLLYTGQAEAAADELAKAQRDRQRQLTRVPSEIFPVALLYGRALMAEKKFDEASVAYLNALKIRPQDAGARRSRAEALQQAGKAEAAAEVAAPR